MTLRALILLASLTLAPVQEGHEVPETPERESTTRGGPVTREDILRRLEAIARAAESLAELGESEESRVLAERIASLATDLGDDLRAQVRAAEARGPSGRRADPRHFEPVATRQRMFGQWGFNLAEIPPGGTSNRNFRSTHFRSISKGGAVLFTFSRAHRNFNFQDCIIEGQAGGDGVNRTRWGIRAYDVIDWRFQHCEWRNIPGEHGCYLSAPGSVTWRDCRFQNLGSQAIQVVYRTGGKSAHETSDPRLGDLRGLHHVQNCVFLEVGKPSGSRPAFALSFFGGPKAAVRIEGCYVRTHDSPHLDHEGVPANSYGAIMVHDRPKVEILDTFVSYKKPDRDVIQIWNCDEVVIEDCEIVEGVIELRNCGKIRVARNRGGAILRVGTGPANTWPLPNVKHEAPISKDFAQ